MTPRWKIALLVAIIAAASATKIEKSSSQHSLFQSEHVSKPLRILAVFPMEGFSHHIMTETLMLELARRGHHVTLASPFPPKDPVPPTYTHINLADVLPEFENEWFTFDALVEEYDSKDAHMIMSLLGEMDGANICKAVYNHPKLKPLLTTPSKFDVVFAEIFGAGCCFAIGTKLQVPTIAVVTSYSIQWMEEYNGETHNPSYIENMFLTPTKEGLSSFVERVKNTYYYLLTQYSYREALAKPAESVVREFLGSDAPSLQEIHNNVSLFLVNTHPTLFVAKPTVPRVLPVGGLHLRPPNPDKLPADVKTWLDTAPNGVVYFSLGSLIRSETIPENLMKAFVSAFKELKHLRFLWKFEATAEQVKAAGIPENVLVAKWLPQMEVLSHPKVLAFITHGGLMGTTESVFNGVPMIGMPVFAEQLINIFRYEKLGIAVRLDHRTAHKEDIVNAVKQVTTDSSIRQRIREVSRMFRDRPMSPLDSAIWWTEYVVRNKGARHLESPVATLPWWQYFLLDVVAAALAVTLLALFVIYSALRSITKYIASLATNKGRKKKKN